MEQLWRFLGRFHLLFLFIVLQLVALFWSRSRTDIGQKNMLNTSNQITGGVLDARNSVTEYFQLKKINKQLLEENAALQKNRSLNGGLPEITLSDQDSVWASNYDIITAKVISNGTVESFNTVTLNKGTKQGIEVGSGILGPKGLVGKVTKTGKNYSIGMPLINVRSRVNVQHKKSGYNGNLVWNTGNAQTASVQNLPRHLKIAVGDTLVTNAYSKVFPENVDVAKVKEIDYDFTGTFYDIRVELLTEFGSLNYVYITQRKDLNEIQTLEEESNE